MATITGVYALVGFPESAFGEFCMALIGATGIYSAANAAQKFSPRPKVD